MNQAEAMKALLLGKRVRVAHWNARDNYFYFLRDNRIWIHLTSGEETEECCFFEFSDFELYEGEQKRSAEQIRFNIGEEMEQCGWYNAADFIDDLIGFRIKEALEDCKKSQ